MEFQCRVIVQRRCTSCCSSVENIPLQAERHSGTRQRLFGLPPESVFSFRPECCSASQRNGVQLQTGIAFTFDRIPQEGRISSVQSKSTISSWVRTEYAAEPLLHMSTMRRSATAWTESSRAPTIARIVDAQCIVQMRPSTRRMTTTKRTSPTPPVGAYPQSRLCGQRGSTPHSAKIKITINMVPSIFAPYSKESGANPKIDPRRSELPPNCSLCRGSPAGALHLMSSGVRGSSIARETGWACRRSGLAWFALRHAAPARHSRSSNSKQQRLNGCASDSNSHACYLRYARYVACTTAGFPSSR